MVKSIIIICDQSPIGRNSVIEAIRFASGLGAIEDTIKRNLILKDDALIALKSNFKPEIMGMQSFDEVKMMAEMSNLKISVLKEDLEELELKKEDLVEYENLEVVSEEELALIITNTDATFKF